MADATTAKRTADTDVEAVRQAYYDRIGKNDAKSKMFSAQILGNSVLVPKTEELLKRAIATWETPIKGYALAAVTKLHVGNLLATVKPLLETLPSDDSLELRAAALRALSNSPTMADHQYLTDLVNQRDSISRELLDCFFHSNDIALVRYWLTLLRVKKVPQDYSFSGFKQPFLKDAGLLADMQTTLRVTQELQVRNGLIRELGDRTDDVSLNLIIPYLDDANASTRFWSASVLKYNPAQRLKMDAIQGLIERDMREEAR